MEHEAAGGVPFFISLFKGAHNQLRVRSGGDIPGDDLSGKQIHYNAQIIPFTACLDISNVAGPDEVGSLLAKLLLKMIGTVPVVCVPVVNCGFRSGHLWQLQYFAAPHVLQNTAA